MTDKLRQAAEMALEELETQVEHHSGAYLAIDALRQALAERHECEPCANKRKRLIEAGFLKSPLRKDHGFDRTASHMAGEYVDTAQPNREWVGLTNDEIDNLNLSNKIKIKQLILLIEAKLKEKNLCR